MNRITLLASLSLVLLFGVAVLFAYRDGPPPASTGGFGESTCHTCHFDNPVSESSESLSIHAPPEFAAGQSYEITVRLVSDGMKNAGFQLSARYADGGNQAGAFRPLDSRTALAFTESDSICYVQHTREGQKLTGETRSEWRFQWEAPQRRAAVIIHVAANAANRDDSEFGDSIHTRELELQPH